MLWYSQVYIHTNWISLRSYIWMKFAGKAVSKVLGFPNTQIISIHFRLIDYCMYPFVLICCYISMCFRIIKMKFK